jgi:hypothetical protein
MPDVLALLWRAVLIGAGATALMDVWAIVQRRVLHTPTLNYKLLGRWMAGLTHGRFVQRTLPQEPSVRGEAALGWAAHYAIGVAFAAILLAIMGVEWARRPTLGPALALGLITLAAPFFVLQPGMGAGVAASRTPHPWRSRLRSLMTHLVFGLGLYLSAFLLAAFEEIA